MLVQARIDSRQGSCLPIRKYLGFNACYGNRLAPCVSWIREHVRQFEERVLPRCRRCRSNDTADVQVGIIGRTIHIAAATSKMKLIPNLPRPGRYFCNACERYFDAPAAFGKLRLVSPKSSPASTPGPDRQPSGAS